MKKVIFLNLFIDNDWDEEKIIDQIYPLKIDSSEVILKSYSHYGVFFGHSTDCALVETPMDLAFLSYLEKHFGRLAKPLLLEQWQSKNIEELILVGVSTKESLLFGENTLQALGFKTPIFYRQLNNKKLLLHLAFKYQFNFPESQLVKLADVADYIDGGQSHCIKFLNSAGGRGVFKVDADKRILSFLQRQLDEHSEIEVIRQSFIPIKNHFYTLASTESSELYGFQIEYDEKGNSKRHLVDKNLSAERIKVAAELGQELCKLGYRGSFGFDGVQDDLGTEYPAIDLNVRLDKSRIFQQIMERGKFADEVIEFRRERFSLTAYSSFDEFYQEKIQAIEDLSAQSNNQFKLIVLLCSNLFHPKKEKTMGELTFMLIRKADSKHHEFDQWINQSLDLLGINGHE